MQNEFERKLFELGLSYSIQNDDIYIILNQTGCVNHLIVQLISSLPINKEVHGSKNGNDVQAIGLFEFILLESVLEPDILVFAFQNPVKSQVDFIIIPTKEILRRRFRINPGSAHRKSMKMVLWLMEGIVYDTTDISPEGEWYFISKGVNGRMADGTEIDYSAYLNSWRRLNV